MVFNRLGGVDPRINFFKKTGSTHREESSQAESFS